MRNLSLLAAMVELLFSAQVINVGPQACSCIYGAMHYSVDCTQSGGLILYNQWTGMGQSGADTTTIALYKAGLAKNLLDARTAFVGMIDTQYTVSASGTQYAGRCSYVNFVRVSPEKQIRGQAKQGPITYAFLMGGGDCTIPDGYRSLVGSRVLALSANPDSIRQLGVWPAGACESKAGGTTIVNGHLVDSRCSLLSVKLQDLADSASIWSQPLEVCKPPSRIGAGGAATKNQAARAGLHIGFGRLSSCANKEVVSFTGRRIVSHPSKVATPQVYLSGR